MPLEPPVKNTWHPTDTGGTLLEADAGVVVDNIFYYADAASPTGKVRRVVDTDYRAAWANVMGVANRSTELQSIANHADIPVIVIDRPCVINDTVTIPQGKELRIEGSGRISGIGTINGGIISANYRKKIFGPNITMNPEGAATTMTSVMWYGAVGSGAVNDQPYIQKAVDTAIRNPNLPRDLYYPRGEYRCDAPVFASNWDGTSYEFFSLNMVGETSGHFTSAAYDTTIVFTPLDTFAIGYQRARSSVIRGLAITGPFNKSFGSYRNQFVTPYGSFTSGTGVRDNRQSPLQGIAIDPVMNFSDPTEEYITAADKYPGLAHLYRGNGENSGSSGVSVRDCRVYGFTVCIGYSLNGHTLNGENSYIENVSADICKASFAYGQGQLKGNSIRNTIHWDRVHTVVDANSYGTASGLRPTPPYIHGMNIAGGVNRVFYTTSNFTWSAKNIFAELLFEIGYMRGYAGQTISDSTFQFPPEGDTVASPAYHIQTANTTFKNCDFKIYDDLFKQRMIIRGYNIHFEMCRFDRLPLEQTFDVSRTTVSYKNCWTGPGNHFGFDYRSTQAGTYAFDTMRIRGKTTYTIKQGSQYIPLFSKQKIIFDCDTSDSIIIPSPGYVTITKVGDELAFTVTPGQAAYFAVGDYVVEGENALVSYFLPVTGLKDEFPVYGRVKTVNYATGAIVLTAVPIHITNTSQAYLHIYRENSHNVNWTASYENGSPVVRDVMHPQGMGVFTAGGSLLSVDAINHTLTYSTPFTFTEKDKRNGDEFYQAVITHPTETPFAGYAYNTYIYPIIKGTIWKVPYRSTIGYGPIERVYVCTKSGLLNPVAQGKPLSLLAEWGLQTVTQQENGTFKYFNFNTDTWDSVTNPVTINITIAVDTPVAIPAGQLIKILVKPTTTLAAFKVGITPGGNEIFLEQEVPGGQWTVFSEEYYFETAGTAYFGGITSSTQVIIVQTATATPTTLP